MPCCNTAPYKRLQRVSCRPCSFYTTHITKQRIGLYRGVSVNLAHSSAHNTAATQADYIPHTPRWRAYHQAQLLHQSRYHRHAGRFTGQSSRPIIIRYIRVRPCYGSMPDSSAYHKPCKPAGLAIWHRVSLAPSTRRGNPAAGTRRAARNHWRLSPYLFSGFRPIANRGQQ